jgi:acyl-CoA hydrolase
MMNRPLDLSVTRTLSFSTDPALRRRYLVTDEPLKGNFRFGVFLEGLDKLAELTALAHVGRFDPTLRVVTAAIDSVRLRCPPDITRDLVLRARVNYVGTSSMEVGIRVDQPGEPAAHIASCYFTMVARSGTGDDARSVRVRPLTYADDVERIRAGKAVERREAYRQSLHAAEQPPSKEEHALLSRLHAAQERPDFTGLLASAVTTDGWERAYPEHENVPEKIFGGHVVHRAFEYAHICAEAVATHRPVVISVNRINFHHPVRIGDKLRFVSRVVYTGKTHVSVETEIIRVSADRTSTAMSNTCVFTFVNADAELRPQPVPPIYPTTYAEEARYLAAYRRHLDHELVRSRKAAS